MLGLMKKEFVRHRCFCFVQRYVKDRQGSVASWGPRFTRRHTSWRNLHHLLCQHNVKYIQQGGSASSADGMDYLIYIDQSGPLKCEIEGFWELVHWNGDKHSIDIIKTILYLEKIIFFIDKYYIFIVRYYLSD